MSSPQTTTIPLEKPTNTTSSSQVVDYYERDGEHFLEVWLIDPSWNLNYWKANPQELTQVIQRFVDKPALLTPYLHHPHEYNHIVEDPADVWGNVRKHNTIDERYRVGHAIKIKPLPNSAYAGILKLTNPAFIEAAKQGRIPRFVSPAVYNLDMTGPTGEFLHFEPLHICFVNEPAYGTRAQVLNSCHGQQEQCLRNLGVAALEMGPSCVAKALDKVTEFYHNPVHSSYTKSNASVASELSVKEDSATPGTSPKQEQVTAGSSTDPNKEQQAKPEVPESKAAVKQQPSTEEKPKDINKESKDKDKDSKDKKVIGKEEIASVLEDLKSYVKDQISESLQTYIEETRKEQEKVAAKDAKRKIIESYVTLESAGGSKEERDRRINALMHIPREDLETFLEAHYKIPAKSRSNAAKASKISDFNRGMQQNAPQNVGVAALLLDQETNDRIDRVLSVSRFVPGARIVPNTSEKEAIS